MLVPAAPCIITRVSLCILDTKMTSCVSKCCHGNQICSSLRFLVQFASRLSTVSCYCTRVHATLLMDLLRARLPRSNAAKPVDGAEPCSSSSQADVLSAQCLACFLRAAAGNVARSPWLGEAGCPALGRGSLAPRLPALLFLCSTSSTRGIRDAPPPHPPNRLFGLKHCSHSGSC